MFLQTGIIQTQESMHFISFNAIIDIFLIQYKGPLYTVVEMRRGQKTRVFEAHRLSQGPYSQHVDMSMSLVFNERKVYNIGKANMLFPFEKLTFYLVFSSVAECDLWWNGLSLLIEKAKQSDLVV